MNKTRILVVEDTPEQAEELVLYLQAIGHEVTHVADNLKDALGYFYAQQPDLVLLDIYLDGKPDGIVFAQTVQANEATRKPFIFLTQHTDLDTFREARLTYPYSYIIKPFNKIELQYAIELALEKFADDSGAFSLNQRNAVLIERDFFVKVGDMLVKVPFKDIDYVEVEGKYSNLVSKQGVFLVQWSLKKLEEKLKSYQFIRIHRNYIVNSRSIRKVHLADSHVILAGDKVIPFSQGFKDNLVNHLDILR